ncbi:SDR family NAD(P)-dependent oxidoreductase [Vibrio sp. JC009]|uniref:SDR family NAD(P)-dependent oxidoreductase n=1 Tax=Vibrio sp. JC009 TaxID=2912314 RepID=UPI0023B07DFB|nr:SDR family NAD(P)-dependent oxidoreductase [Vibrio sp. JC009]WED23460.1 SDR family NAD(P)-dependent oxidoreductase [Vibrio sp. JC009]
MSQQNTGKVALVTGGNQGLGFAIVKGLANRLSSDDTVYLCSRSVDRGATALKELGQTNAKVEVLQLDVTDAKSIEAIAVLLKERHGGIDIIASNAAARINKDVPQPEQVRAFVATNNHGSRDLLEALWPLLNKGARYVMVASAFGQLNYLPERLHKLFDTDTLSLEDIEQSMDHFVESMESGRAETEGWPEWINISSKIGQVATARVAARMMNESRADDDILINATCPGLVDTDASRPWFDDMNEAQSPDQAALAILDLLLTKAGTKEPNGQLVQFGQCLPWL